MFSGDAGDARLVVPTRRSSARALSAVGRQIILHLRMAALAQVPCEDIALAPRPQAVRVSTQT